MDIDRVLSGIGQAAAGRFAIVGAVARNAWAPPRATTDLDLVVAADPSAVESIEHALATLGYRCVRRHQIDPGDPLPDILVFRSEAGPLRQVDLLLAKTPFEAQALERAVVMHVGSAGAPVVTPEDLVVYKLVAHRRRDQDDVLAVLRTQRRAGRAIDWAHVERWCAYWGVGERLTRLRAEVEVDPA